MLTGLQIQVFPTFYLDYDLGKEFVKQNGHIKTCGLTNGDAFLDSIY